jgi:hypothetical protein
MEPIPDTLKQFIFASFETIDQLRMLLLLQTNPERVWSAMAICSRLYLQPDVVDKGLLMLRQKGFLTTPDNVVDWYRYQPASAELEQLVRAVVELDRTRPVTLIKLIYARPKDAAQRSADASTLCKES